MTPTAAIAFRAEQQNAREEFSAKARESMEAKGVSLSRDSYKTSMTAKLGESGPVKFNWDPTTKTVSRS